MFERLQCNCSSQRLFRVWPIWESWCIKRFGNTYQELSDVHSSHQVISFPEINAENLIDKGVYWKRYVGHGIICNNEQMKSQMLVIFLPRSLFPLITLHTPKLPTINPSAPIVSSTQTSLVSSCLMLPGHLSHLPFTSSSSNSLSK